MAERTKKPRALNRIECRGLCAGIINPHEYHEVYVCGDYYEESAQIHLHADEARRLGEWLLKAADYLEQDRCLKRGKGRKGKT